MAILDKGVWYPNKSLEDLSSEDSFNIATKVEEGRYHLYMSYACPFAHRAYLVIKLLGLEHAISISSVAAKRFEDGWAFDHENPDKINNKDKLVSLYQDANSQYSGRVTVPVLWDKQQDTIVNNSSADIAMELATKWLPIAKNKLELVPNELKTTIESFNAWLHENISRKVYHVGFATGQTAYKEAFETLFNSLESLDQRLADSRYLHGEAITLSDLFLLPTLVRFEAVYAVHFKANKKPLAAFENLYRYMLDLVSNEKIRSTIDIEHTKIHYYCSHLHLNPMGIVPAGPDIAW